MVPFFPTKIELQNYVSAIQNSKLKKKGAFFFLIKLTK
jgi:hypothetical protein